VILLYTIGTTAILFCVVGQVLTPGDYCIMSAVKSMLHSWLCDKNRAFHAICQ